MTTNLRRTIVGGAAMVIAFGGMTACGSPNSSGGGGGGGGDDKVIALLLPETKTTRYETYDKPLTEAAVKENCSDCTVKYYNADQDEQKQSQQLDTALSAGAKVIILDPVNGAGAGGMISAAHDAGAKVIAYDRFIEGADYYMSFDNETVGKLQAEALVKAMGDTGGYLMLNGAPSDPNAAQFKAGAHSVLDSAGVKILHQGVRQPRLEPGQRAEVRHRPARQVQARGDQGRVRRQRRPGRWRDRRAEGPGRQAPADHRSGRRARRHPADPRRSSRP